MSARHGQPDAAASGFLARSSVHANERARGRDASYKYEEEYPEYLSLLRDLPADAPFELGDTELRHLPSGNQDSGWQNCLNSVEKYDRELCQAYREQIDTLLVFAGLFSAVVTAFAVESYQWLQDDPLDTSADLLRTLVGLLSQNLNLTAPQIPTASPRMSDAAIVRINSFWFMSLTLSLSAALVGILCKQWLREFERNAGQSPETALGVRYIRFQGLEYWKVGSIVTLVPIIMQMALAFFVIGIVELLWRLHVVVACCVTVVAGLTLLFYLATTLLPVVQYLCICMRCFTKPLRTRDHRVLRAFSEPQCAYKSAQAWLAFRVARPVINCLLRAYGYRFSSHHPPAHIDRILRRTDSWVDFDMNWVKCRENAHPGPRCAFESLTWVAGTLGEMHMSSWIWHCVWARWLKNKDSPNFLSLATREIESVARSYPRVIALEDSHTLLAQSQALIFQCSLRADLPIETALELLLRVSPVAGASSRWTREALHAIRIVYRGLSIRLSDDIALGLFRLAERLSHIVTLRPDGQGQAELDDAALTFRAISNLLRRGTPLQDRFMPAMSGLVLQWLRAGAPGVLVGRVARGFFEDMIWFLESRGYRGQGLQNLSQCPGITFIAKLAGAVVERWPDEFDLYAQDPDGRAVLRELMVIFSDYIPEHSQEDSRGRMEQPRDSDRGADGAHSSPPVPDPHGDSHASEQSYVRPRSRSRPPVDLCIDVHADQEFHLAATQLTVDHPASREGSTIAACSAGRDVPTDSPDPTFNSQEREL